MASVRESLKEYEQGAITFEQLATALASHEYLGVEPEPQNWGEVYGRAEEMPDDDSFFWVESAEDLGILTTEQVEQIVSAMEDKKTP